MSNSDKKLSISFDPKINSPTLYKYFLITSSEEGLRIDFAKEKEKKHEISLEVKESISISADEMLRFAVEIIHGLADYESKYQNGKGLSFPKD